MALRTTVGRLLIDEAVPEDLRDSTRTLDKKGLAGLLHQVAVRHPERYRDVSHDLADVGRRVSTEHGGYSFGLGHLGKSAAGQRTTQAITAQLRKVLNDDTLSDQARHDLIIRTVGRHQERQMDEVLAESLADKNPLALQVVSGARGNKMNLSSLRGSDLLYTDHHDHVIPLPVLRSYSQGLTPAEYWAGSYGARRGVLAVKLAVRDAGALGKQLNQISHRLVVEGLDHEGPQETLRGLPVDVADMDNEGSLLAHDLGPYKRNTTLTPRILKDLHNRGHTRILVRSPTVGGAPGGGVYARDVGVRERGVLPGRGEQVGLTAAQSLSEPLSQSSLAAKHSGGVAGQEKALGGFAAINQLVQVPSAFRGGAAHAETDGRVEHVEPAPAGGHHVLIGDRRHYVAAGHDLQVQKGDTVEAGDVISSGWPNPAVITRHKGIGEGRRYFLKTMKDAYASAGIRVHRRNLELLARGLINHVRLTEETDHNVPDDVVPYATLEHTYRPRSDGERRQPHKALGHYLERPVLHYSIGTKVRPSVRKELEHFGIKDVLVHPEPPPFRPEMVRGMDALQHDPDFMTRLYGSGLKKSLLQAVQRGGTSDELGTSFVPALAKAVDFGRSGLVHSPEPGYSPGPSEKSALLKWAAARRQRQKQAAMPPAPAQPKPLEPPKVSKPGLQAAQAPPLTARPASYRPSEDYVGGTASNNWKPPAAGATPQDAWQRQQEQAAPPVPRGPWGMTQEQLMRTQHAMNVLTGQYRPRQAGYSAQGGFYPHYGQPQNPFQQGQPGYSPQGGFYPGAQPSLQLQFQQPQQQPEEEAPGMGAAPGGWADASLSGGGGGQAGEAVGEQARPNTDEASRILIDPPWYHLPWGGPLTSAGQNVMTEAYRAEGGLGGIGLGLGLASRAAPYLTPLAEQAGALNAFVAKKALPVAGLVTGGMEAIDAVRQGKLPEYAEYNLSKNQNALRNPVLAAQQFYNPVGSLAGSTEGALEAGSAHADIFRINAEARANKKVFEQQLARQADPEERATLGDEFRRGLPGFEWKAPPTPETAKTPEEITAGITNTIRGGLLGGSTGAHWRPTPERKQQYLTEARDSYNKAVAAYDAAYFPYYRGEGGDLHTINVLGSRVNDAMKHLKHVEAGGMD